MGAEPEILLDITRSLRRLRHAHPSGIDRVERAYIEWALDREALFLGTLPGGHHVLDRAGAEALLKLSDGESCPLDLPALLRPDRNRRLRMGEAMVRRSAVGTGDLRAITAGPGVYLNTGHMNLQAPIMNALSHKTRVILMHDLIPLEHPEFARPNGPLQMLERLRAAALADHLIANSVDTADRLHRVADRHGITLPPVTPVLLGIEVPEPAQAKAGQSNHFVALGTIEPRKNHALLLDIWQGEWPDLHIIGRRGWENRETFDRLDRAPANIREWNDLGDAEVMHLIASASALLFPSFVEGFGLPLAEALALGTPVIASDLAALREVGGNGPDYLDPAKPDDWSHLIADYIADGAARRRQQARIAGWSMPGWPEHFTKVEALLRDLMHKKPS